MQTGYKGRIGVHEMLVIDEAMAEALRQNDQTKFESAVKANGKYRPLAFSALERAKAGVTSLDEVLRVSEAI